MRMVKNHEMAGYSKGAVLQKIYKFSKLRADIRLNEAFVRPLPCRKCGKQSKPHSPYCDMHY